MRETIKIMAATGIFVCAITVCGAYAGELKSPDILPLNEGLCLPPREKEERGTISVTGEAKEYFAPDIAIVTLAVETTDKTASEAAAENGKRADKVVKALKPLISPEQGDSIKTSSYSVQPVYEYDNVKKKNLLTGYRARHQVTVRTKKTDAAGKIIDVGIQSGANEVGGVNFTLTEAKDYCEGVLKKAADRGTKEAAFVAKALGAKISGIKSISPSCRTETPYPIYRPALMEARAAAAPETTIEAGDIAVNASITIVFYLEKE